MSALDTQIGGGHYKGMKIQPMEYSMANGLDACQHTAIKYISRFRDKGGIQDLEKAKHCIDMLIEFENRRLDEQAEAEEVMAKPEQDPYGPRDAEGWYAWNGDGTMRPAGKVDVVKREGSMWCGLAEEFIWNYGESKSHADIVKWRPAQ